MKLEKKSTKRERLVAEERYSKGIKVKEKRGKIENGKNKCITLYKPPIRAKFHEWCLQVINFQVKSTSFEFTIHNQLL
jgi:hypothetical protein